MDRNTLNNILAFVLIGALLIAINFNSQRIQKEQEVNKPQQAEITNTEAQSSGETSSTANNNSANLGGNLNAKQGAGSQVTIENEQLALTFDTKGARITKAEVKNFQTYNKTPLLLLEGEQNKFNYEIPLKLEGALGSQILNTQDFVFDVKSQTSESIVFSLDLNGQGKVEQEYRFNKEAYTIDYDFRLLDLDGEISDNTAINLNWETNMRQQEKNATNERDVTSIYYRENGESNGTYLTEAGNQAIDLSQQVDWVAFKQKFFNQTLEPKDGFTSAKLTTVNNENPTAEHIKTLKSEAVFGYKTSSNFSYPMSWYIGPNDYDLLRAKANGTERMIGLGWGIFGFVNRWMIIPMFNFLSGFISNYGLLILVLTVLIKLVLSPLTYRSYVSMAKMQVLKPDIDKIKQKFPDDPQKQQAETMKLYSSAGASPLSGCLPNLLQMPILIAMYNFFPAAIDLRQESFLWAEDLSTYDSILDLPFNLPLYGGHVSLFALLSGLGILLSVKVNSQMSAGADNPAMKYMPYIMPVFLVLIFNRFSAALTYYFFLSNIITFAQQQVIKRFFIDEDAIKKEMEENKKKPKKKGSFQERLEEAMRAQQMAQQQRNNK